VLLLVLGVMGAVAQVVKQVLSMEQTELPTQGVAVAALVNLLVHLHWVVLAL
jgi:hypothetical protein